ncbi:hypothetical protein J2Z37_002898 [Ammoniphilus resinae]|uniref:Uncharacterized protein n=1 Tax=Ammoniphilus resinae TaxID=861532 RepID=A0ABS4GS81_9BACL|nr:hypothetical protein [Ammoniphilus resinae]
MKFNHLDSKERIELHTPDEDQSLGFQRTN